MHSIGKRKEASDNSTQHDIQVTKKQRNEKTQGQEEIEDNQCSMTNPSTNVTTATMAAPSSTIAVSRSVITSGLVPRHVAVKKTQPNPINKNIGGNNSGAKHDGSKASTTSTSGSSVFRAKDIMKNYTPMTPSLSNANTANGALSSSSRTRTFKYDKSNSNRVHRTFIRDPATSSAFTILSSPSSNGIKVEETWGSQPDFVPQAKDSEVTSKSDRNGTTVIDIHSSHDATPTTPSSAMAPSRSVKATASQPDHVIRTDAVKNPTTLINAKPIVVQPANSHSGTYAYPYGNYPNYYEKRSHEQETSERDSKRAKHYANKGSSSKPKAETTITAAVAIAQTPASTSSIFMSGFKTIRGFKEQQQQQENQLQQGHLPEQRPPHKRNDRWASMPSLLFPPGSSSRGSTSVNERSSGGKKEMTIQELAKETDLRLEFLDPIWFRDKRVLDIGCNAALLTTFIALHYKPRLIQGVDIDPSLIGKAQNLVLKTFSQLAPKVYKQTKDDIDNDTSNSTSGSDDSRNVGGDIRYEAYFPKSMYWLHGFLPIPKAENPQQEALFPHNIELRIADWVTEENDQEANAEQWDVILCLSLTKWVHLHHGDEGLKKFFQKIYRSLSRDGILLLEPQAFSTYSKRKRITDEMFETYQHIHFKPDQFQEYLLGPKVGFKECVHLGHSGGAAANFNRDIFLFKK